ncbi:MAG: hypothetical protein QOG29_934 [Gaiellaceae bacterium]|nr:hypothetical protein [Gaiellaceae bacterium]
MRPVGAGLGTFLLLLAILPVASPQARPMAASARTWSVTPRSNLKPGTPLTFTGHGCSKPGTPSSHLEVALGSNFGLVAHVPVADAAGNWHITTRLTPSPGVYTATFDAGCIDNGGHFAAGGSKLVFTYATKLVVTYVAGVDLMAFPLRVREDLFVRDTLGFFTYPKRAGKAAPPSNFIATVAWGDGIRSNAEVVAAPAVLGKASSTSAAYELKGGHRYDKPGSATMTVRVTPDGGSAVSAEATVNVDANHASAFFVANPPSPGRKGIGLFIPEEARPGQPAIVSRRWQFGDGEHDVVDTPTTQSQYNALLSSLVANPGNHGLRQLGIALGILPKDTNDLFGPTSEHVRQVAQVWQAYFPSHVVPHLFDYFGKFTVRQTVIDSSGKPKPPNTFDRLMVVPFGCPPWGGPLSGLFQGYSICDTFNGIATQFGPHRKADYVIFDLTGSLGKLPARFGDLARALNFGGGVALIRTAPLNGSSSQATYLTIHLGAGVGFTLQHQAVGSGWLGPPDPGDTPSSADVRRFVNGLKIDGGGEVRGRIAGQNLGLGFNAVYNQGTGQAGEEIFKGGTAVGAHSGVSCSWPLSDVGPGVRDTLNTLYATWSDPNGNPGAGTLAPLDGVPAALEATGIDLAEAAVNALKACAS